MTIRKALENLTIKREDGSPGKMLLLEDVLPFIYRVCTEQRKICANAYYDDKGDHRSYRLSSEALEKHKVRKLILYAPEPEIKK